MKSKDLCAECLDANAPATREFTAAARIALCQYCGGHPCAGGTDALALVTGVQKLKFMCMACSMEHNRFIQEHLQDASGLSQQEQLALVRKFVEEADDHMRRWVSERDSQ